MILTIHRGTHQIGGCVTALCTDSTRIFIDFGSELPGTDGTAPVETLSIPGLNMPGGQRCDGVFFTHYHGDHIGNIDRILPDVPIYMGGTAKEISLVLNDRLQEAYEISQKNGGGNFEDRSGVLRALERANPVTGGKPITVGDITVTPLRVDHSAFDAYMYLIEADGVRLLHTGDFRDHGYTGDKLLPVMRKYVGQVDWLITEGTMLSRGGEGVMTERELEGKAKDIIAKNTSVFVICSSTNIDRIRAFCRAGSSCGRSLICDRYQKNVLSAVAQLHPELAKDLDAVEEYNREKVKTYKQTGFVSFIRPRDKTEEMLERYRSKKLPFRIVYSMWSGYISGDLENPALMRLIEYDKDYIRLHTSGHATCDAIKTVYDAVSPRKGVIPIHSEAPERITGLLPSANVVFCEDGKGMEL